MSVFSFTAGARFLQNLCSFLKDNHCMTSALTILPGKPEHLLSGHSSFKDSLPALGCRQLVLLASFSKRDF